MIDVSRKILALLDGRSRIQLFFLLVPMLITAVLEMASIGMILPLVQVFTKGEDSKALAWLPDLTRNIPSDELLLLAASVFAAFFVVKNIAILLTVYGVTRFTYRKMAEFMQQMFGLYLHRPYTFYLQRNSAEIMRNLNGGIARTFDGLRLSITIILEVILAAAACLLLLIIEPKITLIIAVTLLVIGFTIYRVLGPFLRRFGERAHIAEAKMIKSINQGFGAIKDIKVLNCYPYITQIYTNQTNDFTLNQTRSSIANQSPRFLVETFMVLGFLGVVLALASTHDSTENALSTLGLFGMAALRLMPSMNRILGGAATLRQHSTSVESLYNDFQEGLKDYNATSENHSGNIIFEHEIRLEDISFQYPNSDIPALYAINITIPKGQSFGLVGPSGSGKSTAVDIILGLLQPTTGKHLVDGRDVFENLPAWQHHIGYVPQNIYLLDDTLRRNIAFGIDDSDVSDELISRAVNLARLDDILKELPDGLDTPLGELGTRLSGGQRQRVGIARALYRDPDILVFDEATSALDYETENEITDAIESLSGQKTIIIIAHRLSTVRNCDCLVFMKEGQIAATGSFDKLSETNEDFQRLIQLGELGADKTD